MSDTKASLDTSVTNANNDIEKTKTEIPATFDRGTKAWLTVAGSAAALFCSFGWCNCIGLFQAYYSENQLKSYPSDTVAWITSLEFFFSLAGSPIAGALFDSYGPTPTLIAGTFLHVFGLMMASLATQYYQFLLAQSICSGIGVSMILTPALTSTQTWFREKRAIAGGLTVAGSSLGGVIFPLMVQRLLPRVGFAWTMRVCAFLILGLMTFAIATIRSNLEHSPRRFQIKTYVGPLGEPNFAILAVSSFMLYWGLLVPLNDIVIAAQSTGVSSALAVDLVPILNGASFLGRTAPNLVADRLGRFNVMIAMTLLSGILCVALWLAAHGDPAYICFAVFFGISSGTVIGIGPALVASISPMREMGTRMGTVMAVAAVAALTAPPISEAIADSAHTYVWTALFAGMSFFAASVGLTVLRGRLGGWTLGTKA